MDHCHGQWIELEGKHSFYHYDGKNKIHIKSVLYSEYYFKHIKHWPKQAQISQNLLGIKMFMQSIDYILNLKE